MVGDAVERRQGRGERGFGGLGHLAVDLLLELGDLFRGQDVFAEQAHLHAADGIAEGVGLALLGGAVELVVVGERVRVGADAVAVDEGGALAGAAVAGRILEGAQAGLGVGAVDLLEMEVGEVGHQAGDVAAGRVHFDGNADGVAVVFNQEDDGQLLVGGGVEGFPELAFGGGTLADACQRDLIAVELDVVKGAVIPPRRRIGGGIGLLGGLGMVAEVAAGLGAADGVKHLRGSGR